jgi:hypothetical protein
MFLDPPAIVVSWETWAKTHWPTASAAVYVAGFVVWKSLEGVGGILKLRHEERDLKIKQQEYALKLQEFERKKAEAIKAQEPEPLPPDPPLIKPPTAVEVARFTGGGSWQKGYSEVRHGTRDRVVIGAYHDRPDYESGQWSHRSDPASSQPFPPMYDRGPIEAYRPPRGVLARLSTLLLFASVLVLLGSSAWYLGRLVVHFFGRIFH